MANNVPTGGPPVVWRTRGGGGGTRTCLQLVPAKLPHAVSKLPPLLIAHTDSGCAPRPTWR